MANYLDNLSEYTSKTIVVQAELAKEMRLLIEAGNDSFPQMEKIVWYEQLLEGANDTTQTEELRLRLLTILVDNARLNEVPLVNVFGLYQTLSDTVVSASQWGLIGGNINDQTDLIAKFNTYLPLAGGTSHLMTGAIYFGADELGIDTFNEGDTLNIGASAGVVQFGADAEIKLWNITEGTWLATPISIAKSGTGQTALGTALQVLRTNAAANGTEWATLTLGTGDVVGPASATDNAIARFDTTTGKLIQNSVVVIGDTGIIVGPPSIIFNGSTSGTITVAPVAIAGTRTQTLQALSGILALSANKLDFFAATSSAELASVISDETGTGLLVFNDTPTLITPIIGVATGTSLTTTGALTSGVASTTAGLLILRNATNAFTQSIRGTGLAASRVFDLPIGDPAAGQLLSGSLSGSTITLTWVSALSNPMNSIGDLIYGGVAGLATRLAGNTAPVRKFLVQTGTGSAANAPTWNIIDASDLPTVPLSKGGLGTGLVDPNANRFYFWDDATGVTVFAVLGAGLSYDAGTKTVSVDATGIVVSVAGTANRITVTGTTSVVVDIASTYAGQATIVTLGTIATGTWQAAIIDGVFGGTGFDVTTLTPGNSIRVNAGGTAWEEYTPSGGGTTPTNTSFTSQTSVTVTHSKGYYPLVQVIDGSGALLSPLSVVHGSTNAFTVTFSVSTTGTIINI